MGLLHWDFVPKPSYFAFKDVLGELAADPPPGSSLGGGSELREDEPFAPVAAVSAAAAPSAADTTGPVLTELALRPRVLRGGRRRARLSFWLSEPAEVTLTLDRARRKRGCGTRCARWSRVPGSRLHAGRAGTNRIAFAPRLRGRPLPAARYRLWTVAHDPAGNSSSFRRTGFRILP